MQLDRSCASPRWVFIISCSRTRRVGAATRRSRSLRMPSSRRRKPADESSSDCFEPEANAQGDLLQGDPLEHMLSYITSRAAAMRAARVSRGWRDASVPHVWRLRCLRRWPNSAALAGLEAEDFKVMFRKRSQKLSWSAARESTEHDLALQSRTWDVCLMVDMPQVDMPQTQLDEDDGVRIPSKAVTHMFRLSSPGFPRPDIYPPRPKLARASWYVHDAQLHRARDHMLSFPAS